MSGLIFPAHEVVEFDGCKKIFENLRSSKTIWSSTLRYFIDGIPFGSGHYEEVINEFHRKLWFEKNGGSFEACSIEMLDSNEPIRKI